MLNHMNQARIINTNTTRIARFGSGGAILRSSQPLGDNELMAAAPSIFAGDKHGSRSERYTYIPTIEVLNGLRKEGFAPFEVRQGGSRDDEKRGFTKHLIRLRHARDMEKAVGEYFRELVLLNSHDGTSSYQLMSGVFRLVCSNGMVVCDGQAQLLRVAHKGDIVSQVIEGAYTIIDDGRRIDANIGGMKAVELSAGEQEAFGKAAAELRFGTREDADGKVINLPPVEARQVVAPRRSADVGNDLWRTFNRAQENLTKGGVGYVHRDSKGKRTRRDTRPVNGIDGNVSLNRALWTLASEMQKLKAA